MTPFGAYNVAFETAEFINVEHKPGAVCGNEFGGYPGAGRREIYNPAEVLPLFRRNEKLARKIDLQPQMPAAFSRCPGNYRLTIYDHALRRTAMAPPPNRFGAPSFSHEKVNNALPG
jgi:hypothetical protein